jgi:hypothetical protein
MTKHKKELEFEGLSKFQKVAMDISGKLQKFPIGMAGRQEFINFSASQLYELQTTAELWRKYYKTANYGDVIAICSKHFREHVADDEENEEV